jgi:hypothetical protein
VTLFTHLYCSSKHPSLQKRKKEKRTMVLDLVPSMDFSIFSSDWQKLEQV